MANLIHLMRIKQGVVGWNAWREKNPTLQPNLRKAGLRRFDLSGADLSEANLRRADFKDGFLSGANLRGADLKEANLTGVRLISANFSGADLTEASLSGADLKAANLSEAILRSANFNGANLKEANLSKASLDGIILADTVLTDVKGLDVCIHRGPSTIDHRTLIKSGQLPLQFLRGCGLPDTLIDYLPSLLNEPLQFYSCFISYSTRDQEFAERLHADLQNKGVRCWFAPHDIQGGKKIHEQIDQAIHVYDKLLLVLSEHSINSPWVEVEIRKARKREVQEKRRMLFPVGLVDYAVVEKWECFDADTKKDLATEIREYFIPDFSHWKDHDAYQKAFDRLLRDLKAVGSKSEDARG